MNADLHSHSTISDGTLAPEVVARRAYEGGVSLYALTDHDEIAGVSRAKAALAGSGIYFVEGVEISVSWAALTVHIVGLKIDAAHPELSDNLARLRSQRLERAERMAGELEKVGLSGVLEGALRFVTNPSLVSRAHFARYLVEAGVVQNTHQAFQHYLVPGKPGYVEYPWATLPDAVQWIKAAGGVAVLAHPGRYKYATSHGRDVLVDAFIEAGGRGIEVLTSAHDDDRVREYAEVARRTGLLASVGSDFHDPQESRIALGALPALPLDLTPVWHDWDLASLQV